MCVGRLAGRLELELSDEADAQGGPPGGNGCGEAGTDLGHYLLDTGEVPDGVDRNRSSVDVTRPRNPAHADVTDDPLQRRRHPTTCGHLRIRQA